MKITHYLLFMVALAFCLCLVTPCMAWSRSVNVATIDDYSGTNFGNRTNHMGDYKYDDYPGQSFTSLDLTGVSAATLAGKDTLVFWGYDPSVLTPSQKADINTWIRNGGKLIIWDSEDAYYEGTGRSFDYSWLEVPFTAVAPGALGASGWPLWIEAENQLATFYPGPYQIDNLSLSLYTDAVGDSAIFTARQPSEWCVSMRAQNVLQLTGPVHVYSIVGDGLVIYSGLDWDNRERATGADLKKILRNEFNADSLPATCVAWTGNIEVIKVADKAVYAPGDTITFTVTVKNPADNPESVYDVVLTDTPPAEITLMDPATYNLGTISPGATITTQIKATADAEGIGLQNVVTAEGKNSAGQAVFSGDDKATFDIEKGIPDVPEFPSVALPVAMILGFVFFVYSMKQKDE